MAEPEKQQMGDGQDNFAQGAKQATQAAKQIASNTAQANVAAANVKAGMEAGKAISEITTGTAMGGPLGAILSTAWTMRHTLYKILICLCMLCLVFVIMITSLPGIVLNGIFGLDGVKPVEGATLESTYTELSDVVSEVVDAGYDASLAKVEKIISDGGYDYDLSMYALINHAQSSAGYDVSYILSAYSASLQQQGLSKEDMVKKLNKVSDDMFPVTSKEKEQERIVPVNYSTYKAVSLTVVTSKTQTGSINGVPQYRYSTDKKTYYLPDESKTSNEEITVDAYREVTIDLPVYSGTKITGTKRATYYEANGKKTLTPDTEIIKYIECTIHPFDNTVVAKAFDIDLDATYPQFNLTYGEVIQNMANALKKTLYGSAVGGQSVPLTDEELITFVNRQTCSAMRKHLLTTGLSLVGKVPYFWGGKSAPGWNDEWNTPKLVTAAGDSTSGTIRPFGLDCSGFTTWVYNTAAGFNIGAGCVGQYPNTYGIAASELLPGDLGFLNNSGRWVHVLMFAGYGENGERMWVHSSGGEGVILNSPSYEGNLSYRRVSGFDYDGVVTGGGGTGEVLYTLEVDVTHYCACKKCCGQNANGTTASGKPVTQGMVAMSSYYPFGTQIEINGVVYTVEDRGGSGIENDRSRVDIYVPDHNQALRLGRFTTTAKIYRIGR